MFKRPLRGLRSLLWRHASSLSASPRPGGGRRYEAWLLRPLGADGAGGSAALFAALAGGAGFVVGLFRALACRALLGRAGGRLGVRRALGLLFFAAALLVGAAGGAAVCFAVFFGRAAAGRFRGLGVGAGAMVAVLAGKGDGAREGGGNGEGEEGLDVFHGFRCRGNRESYAPPALIPRFFAT